VSRHVLDGGTALTAALLTEHGRAPRPGRHELAAPGPGQVLVRVTAAPIAPLDLLCATGTSYFGPPALPYVPGAQGVGEVVGGGSLRPGTRVWFNTDAGLRAGDGSIAEAAIVDEADTVVLPDGVPDQQAAALGLSAVAAWQVLVHRALLQPGEQVLVLGASGVVGQVAVQVALARGAGRVVAASRGAAGRAAALAAGAASVVDLAGDVDQIEERIRSAVDGSLDVVVDPVCGDAATAALRVLGDRGRLVNLGSAGGGQAVFDSAVIRSRSSSVLGYTNNSLTRAQRAETLTSVMGLAAEGRCRVDHVAVGLEDVERAWQMAADGGPRVVVVPPPVPTPVPMHREGG
jgi:NADPH:quinone reductase-like Zn-dependent oxidoreductase